MDPAPEEFEKLRRLLALKRHESPPPGFFDRLSGDVLRRIQAEDAAPPRAWWQTLLSPREWQPAFAGAYAGGLCALLLAGVFVARNLQPEQAGPAPGASNPALVSSPAENALGPQPLPVAPPLSNSPPPGLFSPHLNTGGLQQVDFPKR